MYDRIDLTANPGRDQIIAATVMDFNDVFTGDVEEEPVLRSLTYGMRRDLMQVTPTKPKGEVEIGSEPSAWPEGDFRNSPTAIAGTPDVPGEDDEDGDDDGSDDELPDEDDDEEAVEEVVEETPTEAPDEEGTGTEGVEEAPPLPGEQQP